MPVDELTIGELLNLGGQLTTGGVLLITVVAFLRGWIVPRLFYDEAIKRIEEQDRTIDELNRTMHSQSDTTTTAVTTLRETHARAPDGYVLLSPEDARLLRALVDQDRRG